MIIKKTLNDYNTFDIDLIKDNKILSIYQSGDDINFSCKFDNNSKISNIDFSISNEDNIYYIFNKLYENIINGNVLDENINLNEVKKRIEFQKNMSYYNSLVKDNIITILSDAYPISSPNILKINKNDNEINIQSPPTIFQLIFVNLDLEYMNFVFHLKQFLMNYKILKIKI